MVEITKGYIKFVIKKFLLNNIYIFTYIILSILISVIIIILYKYGLIENISEILPHIITFSTVILGVISLVMAIILQFRDSQLFYQIEKETSYIQQLYFNVKSAIYMSILTILINILILSLSIEILHRFQLVKYILAFVDSFIFAMMLITSILAFCNSFQILMYKGDTKNNN